MDENVKDRKLQLCIFCLALFIFSKEKGQVPIIGYLYEHF